MDAPPPPKNLKKNVIKPLPRNARCKVSGMMKQDDEGEKEWIWDLSTKETNNAATDGVQACVPSMRERRHLAELEAFRGAGSESSLGSFRATRMTSNASNNNGDPSNDIRSLSNVSWSRLEVNRSQPPPSRSPTYSFNRSNETSRPTANSTAASMESQKASVACTDPGDTSVNRCGKQFQWIRRKNLFF